MLVPDEAAMLSGWPFTLGRSATWTDGSVVASSAVELLPAVAVVRVSVVEVFVVGAVCCIQKAPPMINNPARIEVATFLVKKVCNLLVLQGRGKGKNRTMPKIIIAL